MNRGLHDFGAGVKGKFWFLGRADWVATATVGQTPGAGGFPAKNRLVNHHRIRFIMEEMPYYPYKSTKRVV
jgi:hypothetical protein